LIFTRDADMHSVY